MTEVYLGLGSNLGDPEEQLREAVARLAARLAIRRVSSLYRTSPVGVREQPFFLNAVVGAATGMAPLELLAFTASIEDEMGREHSTPCGPRTIDIDILFYGGRRLDADGLVTPHPRLHLRRFVLAPLAEIASELRHPSLDRTAAELLAALESEETAERLLSENWPP